MISSLLVMMAMGSLREQVLEQAVSHYRPCQAQVLSRHWGITTSWQASSLQRKYVLNKPTKSGLLGCKPVDSPMIPEPKLMPEDGELLNDLERYRRLVGKLNYLTVTRPDISYTVSVVSQFMSAPRTTHWDDVVQILRYLKGSPEKGSFTLTRDMTG